MFGAKISRKTNQRLGLHFLPITKVKTVCAVPVRNCNFVSVTEGVDITANHREPQKFHWLHWAGWFHDSEIRVQRLDGWSKSLWKVITSFIEESDAGCEPDKDSLCQDAGKWKLGVYQQ